MSKISELAKLYLPYVSDEKTIIFIESLIQSAENDPENGEYDRAIILAFNEAQNVNQSKELEIFINKAALLLTEHNSLNPLLSLPNELLEKIITADNLANISAAHRSLNVFSKSSKNSKPKKLLEYVLQGDKERVLIAATTNPELFFIKATAYDIAMDLDGNKRLIENWSPYQALFGTGDADLLAAVKPDLDSYLKALPNNSGIELAKNQEMEKFPNGIDFTGSKNEFINLLDALKNAIDIDQHLTVPTPEDINVDFTKLNPATLKALNEFKDYLKPGVVKIGHHFNMNDAIKINEIYANNYQRWNERQSSFFCIFVIGFSQRLKTAPYKQADCTGLFHLTATNENEKRDLRRDFMVEDYKYSATSADPTINVMLSDVSDRRRLGDSFYLDGYFGRAERRAIKPSEVPFSAGNTYTLCQANTDKLSGLMYTSRQQSANTRMHDRLR